jgi:hypothetical protein
VGGTFTDVLVIDENDDTTSGRHRRIGQIQTRVNDREAFPQLGGIDTQQRVNEERVLPNEGIETVGPEKGVQFSHRAHLLGARVKRRQRLAAIAVLD